LPWALITGLAGVVVYVGWLSLAWPLIHDAPIMHYIAWRIGEGAVPYRDLFDMNFPGVYLVHLAVLRTLGASDLAWRVFDLAWLMLTSLTVAELAMPWGGLAAAGGALFFAAYHVGGGAWQAGQRDFMLCPFLLLAALGVALWGERRNWAMLVVGGLALGAGTTIKPHVVIFGLVLVLLLLLAPRQSPRARWMAAVILVASMTIVPLGVLAWLGAIGALEPWREIVTHYLVPFYSRLGRSAAWTVYRWLLWPVVAVVLALSIGHALARRRLSFRHAVVLAGLGYGLLHYAGQGKGWEYHLYPLAAFAGVLLFSEVAAVARARAALVGAPLLAGLAFIVALLGTTGAMTVRAEWIWDKERVVRLLTWDLQQRVQPGDTVQVLDTTDGGVHALLRVGVTQPTRFLYDFHFFHDTEQPAIRALRAEFVSALEVRPPRYIVVMRHGWPTGGYERLERFPELTRRLAAGYRIDAQRADYTIYAKRHGS
jgi:hypothetical protein